MVVELVKKYKKAVTLAIGDGANDVSMIKSKQNFIHRHLVYGWPLGLVCIQLLRSHNLWVTGWQESI
jgi:hypothetical protein